MDRTSGVRSAQGDRRRLVETDTGVHGLLELWVHLTQTVTGATQIGGGGFDLEQAEGERILLVFSSADMFCAWAEQRDAPCAYRETFTLTELLENYTLCAEGEPQTTTRNHCSVQCASRCVWRSVALRRKRTPKQTIVLNP